MVKKVRDSAAEREQLESGDERAQNNEELEAGADETLDGDTDVELEADDDDGDSEDGGSTERVNHRDMYAAEARSVASQQSLREQMAREVEEFLARGGRIDVIEPTVTADPPARPSSDYGSRPL